jgi:uncharacterized protein YjiS (DUF1127 family)
MVMSWILAKAKQIAEKQRLRETLNQMSERELRDIGLSQTDIDRIVQGIDPPDDRPPERKS